MEFVLTEEQQLLQDTAREFVSKNSSLRRIRALRDSGDALGFSRDLWGEMAKLGWLGIIFPEAYGGAGLGYTELMVVLEELGRGLMPEPMISNLLLAGSAIASGGSQSQREAVLPPLIAGDLLLALAYQEPRSRYDPHHVETRAEKSARGWKLTGEKVQVLDACGADRVIVSARTSGAATDRDGITLFLLDAHAPGLSIERQSRIDSRNAAIVRLDEVSAGDDDVHRRRRSRRRAAGRRDRPCHHRPVRRDAGQHERRNGDDVGLPEDASAVRRTDRLIPGPQAPGREDVR